MPVATKQNKTSDLASQVRAERTSESVSGTPAVAVSGNMARGAGEVILASSLATNKGGGGGGSPLLDNYDTTARQSYAKAGVRWKNLDKNRRVRRFYQRYFTCLLYTSPSPRDRTRSRMPSSA